MCHLLHPLSNSGYETVSASSLSVVCGSCVKRLGWDGDQQVGWRGTSISDRAMERIQNGIEGELQGRREANKKDLRFVVASPFVLRGYKVRETGLEPAPPCGD